MICLTCDKKEKCSIYKSTKTTNAKVKKCKSYLKSKKVIIFDNSKNLLDKGRNIL